MLIRVFFENLIPVNSRTYFIAITPKIKLFSTAFSLAGYSPTGKNTKRVFVIRTAYNERPTRTFIAKKRATRTVLPLGVSKNFAQTCLILRGKQGNGIFRSRSEIETKDLTPFNNKVMLGKHRNDLGEKIEAKEDTVTGEKIRNFKDC